MGEPKTIPKPPWKSDPPHPYDREGLPPMSSIPDYLKELEIFRRGIKDNAHRRLYASRRIADLQSIIKNMNANQEIKDSLDLLTKGLFNMIILNDSDNV